MFILSQFNYCSLIWKFFNNNPKSKISQIQKRPLPLRIVGRESISNLDKLVELEHYSPYKIIMTLLNEAYKTIKGENLLFTNAIFTQKRINNQFRTKSSLKYPLVTTSKYVFNTFGFLATQVWNLELRLYRKYTFSKTLQN